MNIKVVIIVVEYIQIKYLTVEHCKALQGHCVLFDDVDEAYPEEDILGGFKEYLVTKGIDTHLKVLEPKT